MPQMSPMSWLTLFIIFSISFIIFNILNYFIFMPIQPNKLLTKKFNNNSLIWKW